MQKINQELYQSNQFYRDLVNKIIKSEQKILYLQQEQAAIQRKLQDSQARRDADMTKRQQQIWGYINQIPYQQMTPISPMQWSAPYSVYQTNFVNYWTMPVQQDYIVQENLITQQYQAEQQEKLRREFHSAVDFLALCSKQEAPIPSIVFDGLGVLTADNLFELIKSIVSLADTASRL